MHCMRAFIRHAAATCPHVRPFPVVVFYLLVARMQSKKRTPRHRLGLYAA